MGAWTNGTFTVQQPKAFLTGRTNIGLLASYAVFWANQIVTSVDFSAF